MDLWGAWLGGCHWGRGGYVVAAGARSERERLVDSSADACAATAMKVGVYASAGMKNDSGIYSVESFIELAASLKLDVLDIRTDKGWGSKPGDTSGGLSSEVSKDYMTGVKLKALKAGLSIGYLASIGHFVGSVEENAKLVQAAKDDVDTALLMGAPLLRCFTSCNGDYTDDIQRREVECFQEICDYAAARGVTVGCQNHPSTGDHMLRIHRQVARENFTFVLDTGQWVDGANGGAARELEGGSPAASETNYDWMAMCAPFAAHVRAKFFRIDSGTEELLDYPRIVKLLDAAGFNGTLGIVFEGGDVNKATDREVFALCASELRSLTQSVAKL